MTVVAYRDGIVAADRMILTGSGETRGTFTKLHLVAPDAVAAACGDSDLALAMVDWYRNGAEPGRFPARQRTSEWVRFLVFQRGKLPREFEQEPFGIPCEDSYHAWGSGAAYALGAMAMGASAIQAVEAANKHCCSCGYGASWVDLREGGRLQIVPPVGGWDGL